MPMQTLPLSLVDGSHPQPKLRNNIAEDIRSAQIKRDGRSVSATVENVRQTVECCVTEIEWSSAQWPDIAHRFARLHAAFSSSLDGSFVRSNEYWNKWVFAPAEGLDSDGSCTAGVLRGWEARDANGSLLAYALFKRAGSFSSGAENASNNGGTVPEQDSDEDNASSHFAWECELTLLDFASQSTPGSAESEDWLLHLAMVSYLCTFANATAAL